MFLQNSTFVESILYATSEFNSKTVFVGGCGLEFSREQKTKQNKTSKKKKKKKKKKKNEKKKKKKKNRVPQYPIAPKG